jgi:hypothetical protein
MSFQLNEESLIAIATPLYIVVIGTEILLSHLQLKKYYTVKDTLMNIYLSLLNAGIDLLFRAVYLFIILQWFYNHHVFELKAHQWLCIILNIELITIAGYFGRYMSHIILLMNLI